MQEAQIPVMSRAAYMAGMRATWAQGEHIAIIGPTGTGKTTLARDLLLAREYVVALAVKRHDDTLDTFKPQYKVITKWPPDYNTKRVVLWLKPSALADSAKQRQAVLDAMERVYLAGGWCVYFDDLSYICDQLRIKTPVVTFFNQGRSSGLSVVASVTRPRKVPLEAFTQTRHTIMFHFGDKQEVERVAEIAGMDRRSMMILNSQLGPHDFLAMSHGQIAIVR